MNRLYSDGNFFVANYCSDVLYRVRQVNQEEEKGQGKATAASPPFACVD